jgi:hypothetical protein
MPMLEEAREEVPFDKASIVQEADDKKKWVSICAMYVNTCI